jgi:hypothetical protein
MMSESNACIKYPVVYTEGDTKPSIDGVLVDTDITGYVIELLWERPAPSTLLIITATPVDIPQGKFSFVFSPGDIVAGCNQLATVRVTDPVADVETISPRLLIDVKPLPA